VARILIIDDDPLVRFAVRRALAHAGAGGEAHEVAEADGAEAGMHAVRNGAFDLALVDLVMPDRNGLELLPEIHAMRPATRLIAISGGTRADNGSLLDAATRLGVTGVLRKPFTARELRGVVDGALAGP
jgi:DNA-binding NarL/FixJ family response regulator